MVPLGQKIELDGYYLLMERNVQGSVMGSINFPVDIPKFVDMYLQGHLKLTRCCLAGLHSTKSTRVMLPSRQER